MIRVEHRTENNLNFKGTGINERTWWQFGNSARHSWGTKLKTLGHSWGTVGAQLGHSWGIKLLGAQLGHS